MKKLKLTANILFAGIGCQERGMQNSGVIDLDVLAISEIDKDAICGYAAMHKGLTPEMIDNYDSYPDVEEMIWELTDKNIGYNQKTEKAYNWNGIKKRQYEIRKHWLANHLCNNLGDISKIHELPAVDLWSCSFPCTDISCAGNMEGLEDGTGTRSSLVWEQMRLLQKAVEDGTQPKYLLFENVENLTKKFMPEFQKIQDELRSLGYKIYWRIMDAKECGIPQTRKRVFVICIREEIGLGNYTFPEPFECEMKVGDILSPDKGISFKIQDKRLDKLLDKLVADGIPTDRDRPIRPQEFPTMEDGSAEEESEKKNNHYLATRLTPVQCFQLMGLTSKDVDKCKSIGIADGQICKLAGNGIVTNCVQFIAEHLYKLVKDPSFICTDERKKGYTLEFCNHSRSYKKTA